MTIDKWTVPESEWIPEEHAEYALFRDLHNIWLESGVYRRMSFEDFIEKAVAIVEKYNNPQQNIFQLL